MHRIGHNRYLLPPEDGSVTTLSMPATAKQEKKKKPRFRFRIPQQTGPTPSLLMVFVSFTF